MPTLYIVGSGSDISKGRQARVKLLKVGDIVRLVKEPNNKHDPFAIRVTTLKTKDSSAKTLGYISRNFSHLLTEYMTSQKKKAIKVPVAKVTINKLGDSTISLTVPIFF